MDNIIYEDIFMYEYMPDIFVLVIIYVMYVYLRIRFVTYLDMIQTKP